MALKYRVNRYNWLAQKLLSQHEYSKVIWLKQNVSSPPVVDGQESAKRPVSEHLNYVHSLALLKTGTRMEAVIDTLQTLNFYQNNQYFLLLCQCLAYLGHHDSVVALCRQVIGHELDQQKVSNQGVRDGKIRKLLADKSQRLLLKQSTDDGQEEVQKSLGPIQQESFDTKKIFTHINANQLIDNPRLWVIFGSSLEYQHQLKDAQTAFRVASMLNFRPSSKGKAQESVALNNYFLPSMKYSEICARYKSNIKQAIQALFPGEQVCPQNISANHILAFYLCKQIGSSKSGLQKVVDLVTNLESYLISSKNPSHLYNQISLSCRQKLEYHSEQSELLPTVTSIRGDETELNFILAKTFVLINSLAQMTCKSTDNEHQKLLQKRVEQSINSIVASNSDCWNTYALWNNLGTCYMIKKRNIASLSCISKSLNSNPLDWRVNFNLGMACIKVGLFCKASVHLTAAKNLYSKKKFFESPEQYIDSIITTLLAICYERLGKVMEARRLYMEATQLPFNNASDAPVLPIVNYLIFLHSHLEIDNIGNNNGNLKVKLHLLDRLEQYWLQRDKNSHQFQEDTLNAASSISQQVNPDGKVYAWMKSEPIMENSAQS